MVGYKNWSRNQQMPKEKLKRMITSDLKKKKSVFSKAKYKEMMGNSKFLHSTVRLPNL